ncbi:MAG: DMT family transporter, partial [Comamonas sp.]
MPQFSLRQIILLVLLTVVWGINWPIMKIGVQHFPPLSFRAVSMWLAVPLIAMVLRYQQLPIAVPRSFWPQLLGMAVPNMVMWHCLVISAIPMLSSGRAAILGFTMPIFSAIIGWWAYQERLAARAWAGVLAALLGVVLLLWHEVGALGSRPVGVFLMLLAAANWAWGTQLLRRARMPVPLLTVAFWMVVVGAMALTVGAVLLEHNQWHRPDTAALSAIVFNGVLVLAFAQIVWFYLARNLPPIASTLSVMFIPVLGVFTGALWLGEVLHWQDWT